jgi:hypothetical protein
MPRGADLHLWQGPSRAAEEHTDPEYILREFRTAASIAFLRRICPGAAKEISQLLRERLSNYRLESAVEIALQAEEMLAFEPGARKMRAHPRLVMGVLESGSWAENERMQQCWAGLLATSCSIAKADESNLVFIQRMRQLTASQGRLFVAACTMATTSQSENGRICADQLFCGAEELIEISGLPDSASVDRDLDQLAKLDLLAPRDEKGPFWMIGEADITPTCLGLALFARCSAHRGSVRDFYGPVAAAACAADESATIR